MHSSIILSFFALPGAFAFPAEVASRATSTTTNVTLFAYGANDSGFPVVYDETTGDLYIAALNTSLSGLQPITWDIPTMALASTTTTTAKFINGTSIGGMHLDFNSTAATPVTIASNATTGIAVFGKQLVYYSGSKIQAKFWAKQVQFNGGSAYMLTWNQQNALVAGSIPVNVKTGAPAAVVS